MNHVFNNPDIGRIMIGALPCHDYSETVFESWDIFVIDDTENSSGTQTPSFPIEIRAERSLENTEVQESLQFLLESEGILSASYVALFRVISSQENSSWQACTSEDHPFSLISDDGPSLVSLSLSPDIATMYREIAIREVILMLSASRL